jgi:hypothetical protein
MQCQSVVHYDTRASTLGIRATLEFGLELRNNNDLQKFQNVRPTQKFDTITDHDNSLKHSIFVTDHGHYS